MKLFKVVLVGIVSLGALCFSAPRDVYLEEGNVKAVKIGNLVWTTEDAGNASLFSEIDLTNACPVGWHVARIEDWSNLFKSVGAVQQCQSFGYEGSLDECDYDVWKKAGLLLKDKSFKGLDKFGFAVLPNGDAFGQKGYQATYWALGGNNNWVCFFDEDDASDYCGQDSGEKYLVRCVKD